MPQDQRAAIVTGAAGGIGAAIVDTFIGDDSYGVIACIDVDESVTALYDDHEQTRPFQADVRDADAIRSVVDRVEADASVVALINNAAIGGYAPISEIKPEAWDKILDVNLKGQYVMTREVTPRMADRGNGYVVNFSSVAGLHGSTNSGVHYAASKAGVVGLTRGLAKQLGPAVNVNAIVPGLVDTSLTTDSGLMTPEEIESFAERLPLNRIAQPDDIADVVRFLCTEKARYMTGSVVHVDGGSAIM